MYDLTSPLVISVFVSTPCQIVVDSSRDVYCQIKLNKASRERRSPVMTVLHLSRVYFNGPALLPRIHRWLSAPWTCPLLSYLDKGRLRISATPQDTQSSHPHLDKEHYLRWVGVLQITGALFYQLIRSVFRGYDRIDSCRLHFIMTRPLPWNLCFLPYWYTNLNA